MKQSIEKYMHTWSLDFDIDKKIQTAMEDWAPISALDKLDVYMNWDGDILLEPRGMAPANEREERMALVGYIDDEVFSSY